MISPLTDLPLFVYGSLLDPGFLERLLGRAVEGEPAVLLDHRLGALAGLPYPIVSPAPGSRVEGLLYRGLSSGDYQRLDAYEGVGEGLYRRQAARVLTRRDGPEERQEGAFIYLPTERTLGRYG